MRMERTPFPSWPLLLLLGPLPALIALAAAIAVKAIPLPTILTVVIIACTALVAGAIEARKDARKRLPALPEHRPELELLDTIPLIVAAATIEVAKTEGVWPLGFQRGSAWTLDQNGHPTPQLCRPAVEALIPVLQRAVAQAGGSQVSCQCPLAEREVVFALTMDAQRGRSAPWPRAQEAAPGAERRPAA